MGGTEWTLTIARHQAPLDRALRSLAEATTPERLVVVVRSREMEDRIRGLLPFPAQVIRLGAFLGSIAHTPVLDDDLLPDETVHRLLASVLPPHYKGPWRDHVAHEHLAHIQLLATNGIRPPYPGNASDPLEHELEAAHSALLRALAPHNRAGRYAPFQRVLMATRGRPRIDARFPAATAIALVGLDWVSPAEQAALENLLKDHIDVHVLNVGRPPGPGRTQDKAWAALAHTDPLVRWAHHWHTAYRDLGADEGTRPLARLFSLIPAPPVPLDQVHIDTARDPDDEVDRTARRIRAALDAGTAPDTIAVVSPRLERYAARIQDIFPQYGIPFTLRHEGRLIATPPGTLLAAILADLEHGHERDRFLDLAGHPLARWVHQEGEHETYLLTPWLRKTLQRRGFRPRGRTGWTRTFDRLAAAEGDLLGGPAPAPRTADDGDTEGSANEASRFFEAQRRAAEALLDRLEQVRKTPTADAFFSALRDLLADLRLVQNAQRAMRHLDDPRPLGRALDALLDLLDDTQRAFRLHDPATPASRARDALTRRLQAATIPLPTGRGWGVQVLGLRNASGQRYQDVHLLGVIRGDLPVPRRPHRLLRLLTRRFGRARLVRIDEDLEVRRIFAGLLTDCTGPVHLLVPAQVDGDPTTPSVLVEELQDAYALAPPMPPPDAATVRAVHREAATTGATLDTPPATLPAARALTAARVDPTALGPYVGHLDDPAVRALAAPRTILGSEEVSASRLNTFAGCAQRSLWHHVARLRADEERDDVLSPLDKGHIVHAIIDRWTRDLLARKGPGAQVDDPADEEPRLVATTADVFASVPHEGPTWAAYREELLSGLRGPHPYASRPPGLLKRYIDHLAHEHIGVLASEAAFGGGHAPVPLDLGDHTIRLRGRIDRIESTAEGWRVVDLKTGNPASRKDIDGGIDLQLPLYLIAARVLHPEQPVTHAAYYQLKRPRKNDQGWKSGFPNKKDPDDAVDRLVDDTKRRIDAMMQAEAAGHYPLTVLDPDKAGCGYCDQRRMCGMRPHHIARRRLAATTAPAAWGYVPDLVRPATAPSDDGGDA